VTERIFHVKQFFCCHSENPPFDFKNSIGRFCVFIRKKQKTSFLPLKRKKIDVMANKIIKKIVNKYKNICTFEKLDVIMLKYRILYTKIRMPLAALKKRFFGESACDRYLILSQFYQTKGKQI
jgi:hypothetical protein